MGLTLNALKKLEKEGVFESQSSDADSTQPNTEQPDQSTSAPVGSNDDVHRSIDSDLLEGTPNASTDDEIPLLNRPQKQPELYGIQDSSQYAPPSFNESTINPKPTNSSVDPSDFNLGREPRLEVGQSQFAGSNEHEIESGPNLDGLDVEADLPPNDNSNAEVIAESSDTILLSGANTKLDFLHEPAEKQSPEPSVESLDQADTNNVDQDQPNLSETQHLLSKDATIVGDRELPTESTQPEETDRKDLTSDESDSIESQILEQTEVLLSNGLNDTLIVDSLGDLRKVIDADDDLPHEDLEVSEIRDEPNSFDEIELPSESENDSEIEEDYNIPATDSIDYEVPSASTDEPTVNENFDGPATDSIPENETEATRQIDFEAWSDDYELPSESTDQPEIEEDYNIPATDSIQYNETESADQSEFETLNDDYEVPSESTIEPEIEEDYNIPATDEFVAEPSDGDDYLVTEQEISEFAADEFTDSESDSDNFEGYTTPTEEPAPFYNPVLSPVELSDQPDDSEVELTADSKLEDPTIVDIESNDDQIEHIEIGEPVTPEDQDFVVEAIENNDESIELNSIGEFGIELNEFESENTDEFSNSNSTDDVSDATIDVTEELPNERSGATDAEPVEEPITDENLELPVSDLDITVFEPSDDEDEELPAAFELNTAVEDQPNAAEHESAPTPATSAEITPPSELERKILERLTNLEYEKSFAQITDTIAKDLANEKQATIVVTSPNETGRGAILTAHMGVLLSINSQKKILLVDADSKKRSLSTKYGVESERGLSDFMDDPKTDVSPIRNTAIESIHLLPFGDLDKANHNSDTIKDTMSHLATVGDYCLVDAGEMNTAFAEKIIANATATVLFVEVGKTTEPELKAAAQRIRNLGGNLIGCVVGGIYKNST